MAMGRIGATSVASAHPEQKVIMKKLLLLSLLGLSLAHAHALASDGAVDVSGAGGFEAQRSAVLQALDDGKTYAEISPDNRRRVVASLNRISSLLGGRAPADLPEAARVEVFNEQEMVNTLLTGARADSRVVCVREKKTGSNRPTNNCKTVAERRRDHEQTQNALMNNRGVNLPPSN